MPDIDFNIKCGNTLVGFVSEEEAVASLQTGQLDFYSDINETIKNTLDKLSGLELEFRAMQSGNFQNDSVKGKRNSKSSILWSLSKDYWT